MKLHREGIKFSLIGLGLIMAFWIFTYRNPTIPMLIAAILLSVVVFWVFYFFRDPNRTIVALEEHNIIAPADGKVVVIEEVEETEYFKEKRRLISIFMSPLSVHVNRAPISGQYLLVKHHPGKFLAAWDPKSSTDNERSTVVLQGEHCTLLLRQVAGAMARRILTYAVEGQSIKQGEELGFIRFGSRVDLYLPLDAKVEVSLGDMVQGNRSVIATVV